MLLVLTSREILNSSTVSLLLLALWKAQLLLLIYFSLGDSELAEGSPSFSAPPPACLWVLPFQSWKCRPRCLPFSILGSLFRNKIQESNLDSGILCLPRECQLAISGGRFQGINILGQFAAWTDTVFIY